MISGVFGHDNIAVAVALGSLQFGPRSTLRLGFCFAVVEAGMTMVGGSMREAWLPMMMIMDSTRPCLVATLAVAMLGLVWVKCVPANIVGNPCMLAGLALLLGVDNLIAGASSEAADTSISQLVAASALMGALVATACTFSGMAFSRVPRCGAVSSAVVLALAAVGSG
jgi:hypothetical protein